MRQALRRIDDWKAVAIGLDSEDPKVRACVLSSLELVYDLDATRVLAGLATDPVRPAAERNMSARPGLGTFRGQASQAREVFSAERMPRTAASSTANPTQDRSYPYIQRKSWKRASGATAVTCPASERAGAASQQSSAASAVAAPADSAIRPRWARKSLAAQDPAFRFMIVVRPPCCVSGWLDLVRGQHRGLP